MLTKNIEQMKKETQEHINLDVVRAGTYWEDGKGCFIGCLTHSSDAHAVTERFGIPKPSVRIAEHIFDRLSGIGKDKGVKFFADISEAIEKDGKDLSTVHWRFLKDCLENLPDTRPEIQKVIDPVIEGMGLLIRGKEWTTAAARAAVQVTLQSDYVASHLVEGALAVRAARAAARTVTDAAVYAADAAAYAARAARAEVADIERQADVFLKLLREADMNPITL